MSTANAYLQGMHWLGYSTNRKGNDVAYLIARDNDSDHPLAKANLFMLTDVDVEIVLNALRDKLDAVPAGHHEIEPLNHMIAVIEESGVC